MIPVVELDERGLELKVDTRAGEGGIVDADVTFTPRGADAARPGAGIAACSTRRVAG